MSTYVMPAQPRMRMLASGVCVGGCGGGGGVCVGVCVCVCLMLREYLKPVALPRIRSHF